MMIVTAVSIWTQNAHDDCNDVADNHGQIVHHFANLRTRRCNQQEIKGPKNKLDGNGVNVDGDDITRISWLMITVIINSHRSYHGNGDEDGSNNGKDCDNGRDKWNGSRVSRVFLRSGVRDFFEPSCFIPPARPPARRLHWDRERAAFPTG